VRAIVEAAHKDVLALLAENRGKLDALATALLEHETLDEDAAYAAAGVKHPSNGDASEVVLAARLDGARAARVESGA